jgi:type I restriction enzyme, S subunit
MNKDRSFINSQLPDGYKQTEVGVIPEDWSIASAVQLCELIVDCKNRTPPVIEGGDFAVVRTPNVRNGRFVYEELRFTNEISFREWTARAIPQIGDILITREAPLGEVCLVPSGLKVCLGQRMMLYRPDLSRINSSFFLYSLMASAVQKCLLKKIGGSTVGHAKVDDIRNIEIPLPQAREEQEAIAHALSDIDALIESLDRLLTKKRLIKQGAMQELLTGRKRLPGFQGVKGSQQTEIGAIPKDWKIQLAGKVCKVNQGLQIEIENRFNYPSPTSKKYITIQYLNEGRKPEYIENYSSSVCCCTEDILMTRTGNTGIVVTDTEGVFHNNFFKINYNKKILSKKYFVAFLRQVSIQKLILIKAGTSTIPDLNHNDFYSIPIIIPPIDEQIVIATILSDMDAEIDSIEAKLTKTRQIKQGMMHELLTGRIRLV